MTLLRSEWRWCVNSYRTVAKLWQSLTPMRGMHGFSTRIPRYTGLDTKLHPAMELQLENSAVLWEIEMPFSHHYSLVHFIKGRSEIYLNSGSPCIWKKLTFTYWPRLSWDSVVNAKCGLLMTEQFSDYNHCPATLCNFSKFVEVLLPGP